MSTNWVHSAQASKTLFLSSYRRIRSKLCRLPFSAAGHQGRAHLPPDSLAGVWEPGVDQARGEQQRPAHESCEDLGMRTAGRGKSMPSIPGRPPGER